MKGVLLNLRIIHHHQCNRRISFITSGDKLFIVIAEKNKLWDGDGYAVPPLSDVRDKPFRLHTHSIVFLLISSTEGLQISSLELGALSAFRHTVTEQETDIKHQTAATLMNRPCKQGVSKRNTQLLLLHCRASYSVFQYQKSNYGRYFKVS